MGRSRAHTFLLLCALAALVLPATAGAQVPVPGEDAGTVVCTDGPTFNLVAKDGRIQTPDGNSVYMWGYAVNDADDTFQIPGPILCVTEDVPVTVTLTNTLSEPTSIVFPGQSGVSTSPTDPGSPGLLAAEAAPSGGTVTYTFTPSEPGTYLYESGTNLDKQIEMGLYGAIIVRPSIGPNFAYDASTPFDPTREYLILIHDIDPDLHHAVDLGQPYDVTTKHDRYWTINGRSFPDTIADNGVPWLPNQPYGSLVWVEIDSPLPALVRYVNAGLSNHPFHPHGNHLRVIARDGRLLKGPGGEDLSMEAFTKTIASGQSYDLFFRFENEEGYTSASNPVPVTVPSLLNLVFKDDLTFYSGSPYLGEKDDLPPAVTSFNECGEFYFPWHSHALNEFQNFNEGFGGLATLVRVDPVSGCVAPVNTSPPTISGLAQEGQTLTATDGTWTGTQPMTFTYQWQRSADGTTWSDIPGATDQTYTLGPADVGKRVRVVVTATNSVGQSSAASEPSAFVAGTGEPLLLSFLANGTAGTLSVANEDIVAFDGSNFTLHFDGSDVGLGALNLDAFAHLDADSILLSFATAATIGSLGTVDDSDVVRFDATSLGDTTAGTFSLYFDGSDVSLTAEAEDVDMIQELSDGRILLSTVSNPTVGLADVQDEDLLVFTPTSLGDTTAGTYAMHFDGSDVDLATSADEDVDAGWTAANGDIFLSTVGPFAVPGASGEDEDVFVFTPSTLGANTAGTYAPALLFDGSAHGLAANDVDGVGRASPGSAPPPLQLSFLTDGTAGGLAFANEDIVAAAGASFSMVFDGSDVGLAAANLDAFAFLDPDSVLLSFATAATIGSLGEVDDSDVVRFDATSLGTTTAGSFSLYFDGSDVSLTAEAEDVDMIQELSDGRVLLSTVSNPSVPGLTGVQDEDLLAFTPTSLGETTAGTYAMHFDGSDVGLADTADEDVDAGWTAANSDIYLSTVGPFGVPGVTGEDDDVFVFTPSTLGATTSGTYASALLFDGSAYGLTANDVDGVGRR